MVCTVRSGGTYPLVFLAVVIAGCGDHPAAPPPPAAFDPTGDWAFTAQLREASQGVTCNEHGVLSLVVSGTSVSGVIHAGATCTGPGSSASDSSVIVLTGGTLTGPEVAFQDRECQFTGHLFTSGSQVKASGSVTCAVNVGGTIFQLAGTWDATYVGVVTPPTVSGSERIPAGDTVLVPGDTLAITVSANDSRHLAFVGYRLGSPASSAESLATTDRTLAHNFAVVIPRTWLGGWTVTAFARDSAGFAAESKLPSVRVIDMARPPTRWLTLPAPVRDVAVDPKRAVVYLSYYGRRQIGVLDLASAAYHTALNTSFPPRALDLSVGGDSLVVSVDSQPALGIIALPGGTVQGIVPVDSASSSIGPRYVTDNVRVLANNKALASLTYAAPYSCCAGFITEYSLTTGTSVVRSAAAAVTNNQPLARSWDRARLVMITGSSNPPQATVYIAAADSFAAPKQVSIPRFVYPISADSTGARFLIANALFDGQLNPVSTFTLPEYAQGGGTVLSPDGGTAYLATYDGVLKVRASDGTVLRRMRLPLWALRLAITPDGRTLIAVGGAPTYFDPPNNQVLLVSLQ